MNGLWTVLLLILSNTFMTFAWYGHLRLKDVDWFESLGLIAIILISWGIALFEYIFMIPANRIGYNGNGGPFSMMELKIIQEIISLTVFVVISTVVFKSEVLKWNHLVGFGFMVLAVYFVFKK